MTRADEINKAVEDLLDEAEIGPEYMPTLKMWYKMGAKWADSTMVDKACKWFEEYLFELGFPDDWLRESSNIVSGEQRFRKAMEE